MSTGARCGPARRSSRRASLRFTLRLSASMCGHKESLGKRPAPKGPRVWQLRAVTGSALRGAHSGVCVVPKLKARPSSRRSCMSASTCDTFRCARCGPSLPRKAKSSEEYPHARCESIRTARLKAANTHPWAAARHRLRTSCVTVRRRRGFLGCPKTQTSSPWEPCSYSFDAIGPKQSSAAMALLRLALLAAVSARSPLETLCDGDRLVVVAGYHHSCTTVLQAQLAQRIGLPVPSVRDERWPTEHPKEACSNAWSVFRKPLSGLRDVHRFARLRNRFPAARLVFCTRGAPDQIWSLMKRSCSRSPRLATYLAKQRCQVHDKEGGVNRARATGPLILQSCQGTRGVSSIKLFPTTWRPRTRRRCSWSAPRATRRPSRRPRRQGPPTTTGDGGRPRSPSTRLHRPTSARAGASRRCYGRSGTAPTPGRCRP